MKTIVISAVNLRKGGTLTILRQCLGYLSSVAQERGWRVVALVHQKTLAEYDHIEYIELPWTVQSWAKRLWCEYVAMHRISQEIGDVTLWLSLHDATPRVQARRQAVYCHTSFPFFPIRLQDFLFDPKIPIFGLLTKYTYRINQRRNKYIIVQQEWIREAFKQTFGLKQEQIILARADKSKEAETLPEYKKIEDIAENKYIFFYASTPDAHKDFQTLCRATELLAKHINPDRFEVIITVAGNENKYAEYLHKHWGHIASLRFAGLMDKATLYAHYARCNCFVFPSRIETWGLPISEYMQVHNGQRAMILPKLSYAYETSLGADRVAFFESRNAEDLARLMQQALEGNYQAFKACPDNTATLAPTADNWEKLFDLLLADL